MGTVGLCLNGFHHVQPPKHLRAVLKSLLLRVNKRNFNFGPECCNQSVPDIARGIAKAENILVMAGAGMSTPSGIPDFRSPGSGIYHNLKKYNLPYPEAIFDISYFRQNPRPFNTWAKEFFPGVKYKPNIAHFFVKLLHDKGKLTRLYTQNIDGLEMLTGLPGEKVVHAHGSFTAACCIICGERRDLDEVKNEVLDDDVPICPKCGGFVKPDIVFFGEMLPERFAMHQEDCLFSDYLICIGTSLEVYPFASIADAVPMAVPRLLVNMTPVGSFGSRGEDSLILGDLVDGILKLAKELKWDMDLDHMVAGGG